MKDYVKIALQTLITLETAKNPQHLAAQCYEIIANALDLEMTSISTFEDIPRPQRPDNTPLLPIFLHLLKKRGFPPEAAQLIYDHYDTAGIDIATLDYEALPSQWTVLSVEKFYERYRGIFIELPLPVTRDSVRAAFPTPMYELSQDRILFLTSDKADPLAHIWSISD